VDGSVILLDQQAAMLRWFLPGFPQEFLYEVAVDHGQQ